MDPFSFRTGATRVEFGRGAFASIADLIGELGGARALVLATTQQRQTADAAAELIGPACVDVFAGAVMHTPVDVSEAAVAHARSVNADCVVSVGGGSTTGLGKAIAYRTGLTHIVVPTTYAGSEVTPILGQTENGAKTTLRHESVLPNAVLYDPELTDSLPLGLSIVSGLNAIAHAAEALYAENRNPVSSMLAVEGVTAMKGGLMRISESAGDAVGRDQALYGAWLCGAVLGQVGMALHHKICHTLGGSFNMPHAETHAVMLPHTIGYNEAAVPAQLEPIAEIFGGHAGAGLFDFSKRIGAPTSLADLGFQRSDLDRAAKIAAGSPYWNPRPVTQDGLRAILQDAFDGVAPSS